MAERTYTADISVALPDGAILDSLEISMGLGQGESGSVSTFGTSPISANSCTLRGYLNGQPLGVQTFSFLQGRAPRARADGVMSRVSSVTWRDWLSEFDNEVPPEWHQPPVPIAIPVPYAYEALLGAGLITEQDCEDINAEGKDTNIQIAMKVMSNFFGSLIIRPGAGLVVYNPEITYTTEGKTVMEVLNELVLTNGVRWWLEGNDLIVDGRALPQGEFIVPETDIEDVQDFFFEDVFASQEPEPQLEDFLADCEGETGGQYATFETSSSAQIVSTSEPSGFGDDFSYSRTTITKSGGVVTQEVEEVYGDAGLLTRTTKTYSYHPQVPNALIHQREVTMRYPHDAVPGGYISGVGGGGVFLGRPNSPPYAEKSYEVEQEWHAEGYLKRKVETTREFQYMYYGAEMIPLYRDSYRTTIYAPTGNGQWKFSVQTSQAVQRIVVTVAGAGSPVPGFASYQAAAVYDDLKTFTSGGTTDQAPPTISLPVPDCREETCQQRAQREFDTAHANWEAARNNNPDKRVYNLTLKGLHPKFSIGNDYGGARIVSVNYSYGRDAAASTSLVLEEELMIL